MHGSTVLRESLARPGAKGGAGSCKPRLSPGGPLAPIVSARSRSICSWPPAARPPPTIVVAAVPIWAISISIVRNTLSDDDDDGDGDHLCHASGCLLPPPSGPARRRTKMDGGRSPPPAGRAARPTPAGRVHQYAAPANTSDELKPPLLCMHHRSLGSVHVCRIASETANHASCMLRWYGSPGSGVKGVRHCARGEGHACVRHRPLDPFLGFSYREQQ